MSTVDVQALAAELAPLIERQSALLTADEAGDLLNVPASWLMTEARAGRVPHKRLGKYVRFNRDELLAWLDGRSFGPRSCP